MLVRFQIVFSLFYFQLPLYSLNVTIIESQFNHTGNDSDLIWSQVVSDMGHIPLIVPYSTLDNTLFIPHTDILIIPAGAVGLSTFATESILSLLRAGKSVYIQSEYLPHFTTNMAFRNVVHGLGGSFEWQNLFSDDLEGIRIVGTFATTPNIVDSLDYYWFSVSGKGDCNMISFLEYGGEYHGFQFIPPNHSYGTIITTSDGDWVATRTSTELMENIIAHLEEPADLPDDQKVYLGRDTVICRGRNFQLEPVSIGQTFHWQDGSNGSSFRIDDEGIYSVTASLECGDVTDSVFVQIEDCDCSLYAPNIFSPNGDHFNDTFLTTSTCQFSDFSIQIYDRWGGIVFQSENQGESWDGSHNSEDSISGVYTFLIRYQSGHEDWKHVYGDVTLLR